MPSLSFLVHGGAKVGKSTLGGTSPRPIVILDAEGSTQFLPLRFWNADGGWDPRTQPPPAYDGTWDAAVVHVRQFEDLDAAKGRLLTGQHHFRSLVFDSVTEGQRKLKQHLVGAGKMSRETWDDLLRNMDVLLRDLRDLTRHPTNPLQTATFICETRLKDGKYKPVLQGQLADAVPYWFDVVGYLWQEQQLGVDGTPAHDPTTGKALKLCRLLTTSANPLYEAGERVQGRLPDVVDQPDISTLLATVFPPPAPTSQEAPQ